LGADLDSIGDRSSLLRRIDELESQVREGAIALDDVHRLLREVSDPEAALAEVVNAVERSASWRMTAPLRKLRRRSR
jgi:hypothetical protein